MPPKKSVGAARRARKAIHKQAMQEQGPAHPSYVENFDPGRPRNARQDRALRAAVRAFDERVGAESDEAVLRRPAGNQPSHYAKARSRAVEAGQAVAAGSAAEACPPQHSEAASSSSGVPIGVAGSAVEACPPQHAEAASSSGGSDVGAPSGSGQPIEIPILGHTALTVAPRATPRASGEPIEIPISR